MIRTIAVCLSLLLPLATIAALVTEDQRLPIELRANDDYIGIVSLMQTTKPVRPAHDQGDEPFCTGSIVLLFNAKDLDATFAKARQVRGVRVLHEPGRREYPSYDGKGTIPVMVSVLADPDGFVIELNQLLVDKLR